MITDGLCLDNLNAPINIVFFGSYILICFDIEFSRHQRPWGACVRALSLH